VGRNWVKWAPLTGVLAVLLLVLAAIVGGESPDPKDSSQEVIDFFSDNEGQQFAAALLAFYSAVLLIFFASVLWGVLRRAPGATGRLASIALAGGVLMAFGILIFGGLTLTLADTADDLDPAAAQAINALNGDLFFPVAGGTVALLIGSGLSILRGAALPRWLGWAAIVIGVVAATLAGFFAFLAALLWIAVTSIVLFTSAPLATEGAAAPPPRQPAPGP
jgi:hypothetical protein